MIANDTCSGQTPTFVSQGTHFTPLSLLTDSEHRILSCGVDGLDVSMRVEWGPTWPALSAMLQRGKHAAQTTPGGAPLEWPGVGTFIIFDRGRPPAYAYHIKTEIGNLWIAHRQQPHGYANVFASLACGLLWKSGVAGAVNTVAGLIKRFGGIVTSTLPSRVDVCVDTFIPGGVTLDFLTRHKKTRCQKINPHFHGDDLIGYDVGEGGDVFLRMYDKSREITNKGKKTWQFDIWGVHPVQPDVWRTEFQVRRGRLRTYGVNTIDDLLGRIGGIWSDMTDSFFSLRHKRGQCSTRWPMIPLWRDIHEASTRLGPALAIAREVVTTEPPSLNTCIRTVSGYVIGYAARRRIFSRDDALDDLAVEVRLYLKRKDFPAEVRARMIRLGHIPPMAMEGSAA